MLTEIYIGDIIDKLPDQIQSIIFSDELEQIVDNLSSIIGLDEDQKMLLSQSITTLLMGKYDFVTFKNVLLGFNLSETNINLALDYLNKKLFDKNKKYINDASYIYQEELQKLQNPKQELVTNFSKNTTPSVVSYIKELAETIKQKESHPKSETALEVINNDNIAAAVKTPIENTLAKTADQVEPTKSTVSLEPVKVEEAPKLETPVLEKKDSILLQAMRQHSNSEDSKLNKYYKELRDSLSEKTKETKNVFQPPFKSATNHGALIESFLDDTKVEKATSPEANNLPVNSAPIKYSH